MTARLLLISQQLSAGGSERQLTEVARALDRRRFDGRVATFRDGGERLADLRAASVPVEVLHLHSFRKPETLMVAWHLASYLRRERIDLVHTFDVPATIFATPVSRLAGTRVVLSSHRASRELSTAGQRWVLRRTDGLVNGIVTNTLAGRRALIEDDRVPERKVHHCPNGLDTRRFSPGPARTAEAGTIRIGALAVLRPEKALDTLVDAVARLHASGARVELVIMGDGPLRGALEARAREQGLAAHCRFIGANQDVVAHLRTLDVFVLPSRSEAMSNALMEAMACGCAVVASNVGGNPAVVRDGATGVLFPAGDTDAHTTVLARLCASAAERGRLSQAARNEAVARFDLAVTVQQMAAIYERALAG